MKPTNDNFCDSRKPIGCPTLVRFVRNKNVQGVKAIMFWRDLTKPFNPFDPGDLSVTDILEAANDNENLGYAPERHMDKLLSKEELEYIERAKDDTITFDKQGRAHLGGLIFYRGKCVYPTNVFSDLKEFKHSKATNQPNGYGVVGNERYTRDFDCELVRSNSEKDYRHKLEHNAVILDMACSDYTAKEIGISLGHSGKHAERVGIRGIDSAIEKLFETQYKADNLEKIAA